MRVLVHEWVTGGGLAGAPLPPSWAEEGRAIRRALAEDFQGVPGVSVVMTLDERFAAEARGDLWESVAVGPGGEGTALARLAASCEYTVLIAPETGGVLEARAGLVERAGGTSLGSTPGAVALAADKLRLAGHLAGSGVPTPRTEPMGGFGPPRDFPYPAVLKPNDGAGSLHTYVLDGPDDRPFAGPLPGPMVLQPFCPGEPLSATFLVAPDGALRLVGVGRQRVERRAGRLVYRGGRMPAPPAHALGGPVAAVRSVAGLRGVVGVDFVRDPGTGGTTVIEINPRPTTSYVGLRHLLPPGAIARAWLGSFLDPGAGDDLRGMVAPETHPAVAFRPDGVVTETQRGSHARPL